MKRSHSVVARTIAAPFSFGTSTPPPVRANPIAVYTRRRDYSPLILAAFEGDQARVDALLTRHDIDVDQRHVGSGGSALITAAKWGHLGVVVALLDAGADVNSALLPSGATALLLAAANGHVGVVKALLMRPELDLEYTVANGRTALHAAAFMNRSEVAACLLAAGADVNLADRRDRDTALTLAAAGGHAGVVQVLLAWPGIRPHETNRAGCSALHLAARNGHPDVVGLLLDQRAGHADSRVGMAGDEAALTAAVGKRHAAVIDVFMEHGADLPGFDFFAPGADAFTVTVADLHASHRMPVAPQLNPLGLLAAPAPDQLHPCLQKFIDALDAGRDLPHWLREQGLRMTCAAPVARCLASCQDAWNIPDNQGRTLNARQKEVYCVYALSRLRVLTAGEQATEAYRSTGMRSASVERLVVVARRQIDGLVAMAEQALQTLHARMMRRLLQDCLAWTTASLEFDVDALAASLTAAGFFSSLAQGISVSWQHALVALESEPVVVPANLTMKQTVRYLHDHTARSAPHFFSRAIERELDRQPRHTAQGPRPGSGQAGHDLDALFQIQCVQLRQYCRHLLQMNQAPARGAAGP